MEYAASKTQRGLLEVVLPSSWWETEDDTTNYPLL